MFSLLMLHLVGQSNLFLFSFFWAPIKPIDASVLQQFLKNSSHLIIEGFRPGKISLTRLILGGLKDWWEHVGTFWLSSLLFSLYLEN